MITSTFFAKFQLDYVIMYILQTRMIFHVLVSKICSANRNNFKLSQLGDSVFKISAQEISHSGFYTLVYIFWIWLKWAHNHFYCFPKFQCDDKILVHFTDQKIFFRVLVCKINFICQKENKINKGLSFPANLNSKINH